MVDDFERLHRAVLVVDQHRPGLLVLLANHRRDEDPRLAFRVLDVRVERLAERRPREVDDLKEQAVQER